MVNRVVVATGAAEATTATVGAIAATAGAAVAASAAASRVMRGAASMSTVGLHHGWARGGEEVERGISDEKWGFDMKMGRWWII